MPAGAQFEGLAFVGQQRGVAAGGSSIHRHHLLQREAMQIVGAAGFRPGTGQAAAAERLTADHRADHVAVHVDITVRQTRDDLRDRGVDARMDAEREGGA